MNTDRIHAMSVPEILVQRILADIASGKMRTGDRLPAQRDLALQYKISNSSVREAMQTLQGMGIVEVRHPTGTFVVGELMTSSKAIRITSPSNPEQFQEAMEARCLIEMNITRLAAIRATTEQVKSLRDILDSMSSALRSGDFDLYSELDLNLHIAIAQSGNNRFLTNYVNTLRTILGDFLKTVPGTDIDLQNHIKLVEAIKKHSIPEVETSSRELLIHVASNAVGQQLLTRDQFDMILYLLRIK